MNETLPLLVVVTGMSGAGKSTAVHALEDVGYFCVDNLPTPAVAACLEALASQGMQRIALGIDVRVRSFLEQTVELFDALDQSYAGNLRVLFLDASDQALLRRYSSTRRPHPLSMAQHAGHDRASPAVLEGISRERDLLSPLRARASLVLDSTELSVHELRSRISLLYGPGAEGLPRMRCRFLSFGFKYGTPLDADLVFDARFLQNPYFVEALSPLSGLEDEVRKYVLDNPDAREYVERVEALLAFCAPRFEREGKSYLTVAVGCTGGRHRSVVLAEHLAERAARTLGLPIDVTHRDILRHTQQSGIDSTLGKGRAS